MNEPEPAAVLAARLVIRAWELRHGHCSYVEPLGGGYRGYQARCWDCEWTGAEYLRGDEDMSSEEGRSHKARARDEAARHQAETKPVSEHPGPSSHQPADASCKTKEAPKEGSGRGPVTQ